VAVGWAGIVRDVGVPPEDPQDRCNNPFSTFGRVVTKQINTLNRPKRAAATDVTIGYFAFIEADWDEPRVVWTAQPKLLDGQSGTGSRAGCR